MQLRYRTTSSTRFSRVRLQDCLPFGLTLEVTVLFSMFLLEKIASLLNDSLSV